MWFSAEMVKRVQAMVINLGEEADQSGLTIRYVHLVKSWCTEYDQDIYVCVCVCV